MQREKLGDSPGSSFKDAIVIRVDIAQVQRCIPRPALVIGERELRCTNNAGQVQRSRENRFIIRGLNYQLINIYICM